MKVIHFALFVAVAVYALPLELVSIDTVAPSMNSTSKGIGAVVKFADDTWNCDGSAPPCSGCKRVADKSGQSPYGCAPYVAHCLAAGGYVPLDECGSLGAYSSVSFGGISYDLNVVGSKDANCGSGHCLTDYLKARGWTKTDSVSAGTVCAVDGSETWGHIVIGVGNGIVNAHNNAHYHVPISMFPVELCLNPPA